MRRVAVVTFPGMNCENETARAIDFAGAKAEIVRYNAKAEDLAGYDAYVFPGGFSYQDRVRAGVIVSKDPLLDVVAEAAEKGKPILGICNGAQVLVEAGLAPGLQSGRVEACLASNIMTGRKGYYCRWVFIKAGKHPEKNFFTSLLRAGEVIPIPIAHAEGRFVTNDEIVRARLVPDDLGVLTYCHNDGTQPQGFPDNPNGSLYDLAAIGNPAGNVLAIMPHPERASWLHQVPTELAGDWGEQRREMCLGRYNAFSSGPGMRLLSTLGK